MTKPEILKAVESLPEDATLEDAIERLIFLHKVQIGMDQVRSGQLLSKEEVFEARADHRKAG